MTHVEVPKLAEYRERIAFHFDDEIVELTFPAPYLNHHPTWLIHHRSSGKRLEPTEIRPGYEEGFVRELEHFWGAVVENRALRNTVAEARADQALLIAMARKADRHDTLP